MAIGKINQTCQRINTMPSENSVEPQGETLHHTTADDKPPNSTEAGMGESIIT